MPLTDSIFVNLKSVLSVFQIVRDRGAFCRKLARLAHWNEARAHVICERRGEDKATRFDADDRINLLTIKLRGERVHRAPQSIRVLEQSCDVIKVNSRFWEIRDFTN